MFPWSKAFAAGGLAFSAVSVVALLQRKSPEPVGRVALIGDSYAVGLGPELKKLLPDFEYEGREGSNTWQWAHDSGCGRCMSWLASFKPRIVLVSLGTNDGDSPNIVNYQTIVRRIHGIGAHVLWIEPPASVDTPSRGIISSLGVATVPATHTQLASDNLHPLSYGAWAKEISEMVASHWSEL